MAIQVYIGIGICLRLHFLLNRYVGFRSGGYCFCFRCRDIFEPFRHRNLRQVILFGNSSGFVRSRRFRRYVRYAVFRFKRCFFLGFILNRFRYRGFVFGCFCCRGRCRLLFQAFRHRDFRQVVLPGFSSRCFDGFLGCILRLNRRFGC